MKRALSLLALLPAWLGAAHAGEAPACQAFSRASPGAPQLVRDWLARSEDEQVLVCTPPDGGTDAAPLYSGESGLIRRGAVCSYSSHTLIRVGSGGVSQLQRYERGETVGMTLAGGDCPAPHGPAGPGRYTATWEVNPAAFVSIVQLWTAIAASAQSFDRETCCDAAGAGARLRAAIEAGRMKTAHLARIVRLSGRPLHRRYALFVADPDAHPPGPTLYVIYLSKRPGGPYRITAIADAAS